MDSNRVEDQRRTEQNWKLAMMMTKPQGRWNSRTSTVFHSILTASHRDGGAGLQIKVSKKKKQRKPDGEETDMGIVSASLVISEPAFGLNAAGKTKQNKEKTFGNKTKTFFSTHPV